MSARRRGQRGFSLLEVLFAMSILLVGSVGALQGVISSNAALRDGQQLLYKQVLIDASLQRVRLQNKEALRNTALVIASAGAMPSAQSVGTGNWAPDPTPVLAGDLSTGSLYLVPPDGGLAPCTASTVPACTAVPASCADPAIPLGVFCREVVTTRTGGSFAAGAILPANTLVIARWVRVVQRKTLASDTAASAVLGREVFAQ